METLEAAAKKKEAAYEQARKEWQQREEDLQGESAAQEQNLVKLAGDLERERKNRAKEQNSRISELETALAAAEEREIATQKQAKEKDKHAAEL